MSSYLKIAGRLSAPESSPGDALDLKNALELKISKRGKGRVIGGGCSVLSPEFDLQVATDAPESLEAFVRDLLLRSGLMGQVEMTYEVVPQA